MWVDGVFYVEEVIKVQVIIDGVEMSVYEVDEINIVLEELCGLDCYVV